MFYNGKRHPSEGRPLFSFPLSSLFSFSPSSPSSSPSLPLTKFFIFKGRKCCGSSHHNRHLYWYNALFRHKCWWRRCNVNSKPKVCSPPPFLSLFPTIPPTPSFTLLPPFSSPLPFFHSSPSSPSGDVEVLDYREAAPGAATYDMYSANNWSSLYGPLASGVPGSFKGYSEGVLIYLLFFCFVFVLFFCFVFLFCLFFHWFFCL